MDSTYLNSWLREAQQFGSRRATNDDLMRDGFPQSGTEVSQSPPSRFSRLNSTSQMSTDEPLDLRIKQEPEGKPVDPSAPLDLTLNKPQNNSGFVGKVNSAPLPATGFTRSMSNTATYINPQYSPTVTHDSSSAAAYAQHMSKWLPQNDDRRLLQNDDRRLHCTFCGYQCDLHQREGFEHHMGRHVPHSQHYCIHCHKLFPNQLALRDHLPSHNLLYAHICIMCSLAFKHQHTYVAHMAEAHSRPFAPRADSLTVPQMVQDRMLLKIGSVPVSPSERSGSVPTPSSNDLRSSSSNTGASNSGSSPSLPAPPMLCPVSQHTTFGQSLAKQIEAAIAHQVAGGKKPSLSEVMFMKSDDVSNEKPTTTPACCRNSNPLTLMSLLDKVVEQSIRAGSSGLPAEKPDLKFMVTFSDEEDDHDMKESDGTVASAESKSDSCNTQPVPLSSASCERAESTTASTDNITNPTLPNAPSYTNHSNMVKKNDGST